METNIKIKKRKYLVDNFDNLFSLLVYYKAWGSKIKSGKSIRLWKSGQSESTCDLNEIT